MKFSIITAILVAASTQSFAAKIDPDASIALSCVDNVSGYTYELAVKDIGDEEAIMAVFGPKGALLRVDDNVTYNTNREGADFLVFQDGKVTESISIPGFELEQAVYADGGDSRPVVCTLK